MLEQNRLDRERAFHDKWASEEVKSLPNCRHVNEALTSPELRYIHSQINPVKGLKVLDVGCGLGEASAYFAIKGADVTSMDLSPEMLKATTTLAEANGVKVKTHVSAAEDLGLKAGEVFDVIYVGNLFHHVDIGSTLHRLVPHLKKDGRLVSWDPLAYNPLINVYRMIAKDVRTEDEHPLTRTDVKLIGKHFGKTEVKFFWFFSLIIFVLMAIMQRRNPNKERFWKVVVDESDRWAWLYRPLAKLDEIVLSVFPFLGWLCWNIVIIGSQPIEGPHNV